MNFDFPKKVDVEAAFALKKEKAALLRKQKQHVTIQMLKEEIGKVLTADSGLCEEGFVSVPVDAETFTDYPEVVQECIRQLVAAGWTAVLDYGKDGGHDPVAIKIS